MTIGVHALAKLYRGVLDEALAAVRKAGAVDRTAELKIKDAFGSAIPSIAPASLEDKIDGPTLEAKLRSDAAALLFRICQSFPRGEFVATVAKAAKASIDAFRAQKMANPTIQLLTFKGCPLAPAARESLQKALAELGIPTYQEVGILDSAAPQHLRLWPSPTILVDGQDVNGGGPADNICCRTPESVPSTATIVASIRRAKAGPEPLRR
jgi:hypothetical protein